MHAHARLRPYTRLRTPMHVQAVHARLRPPTPAHALYSLVQQIVLKTYLQPLYSIV